RRPPPTSPPRADTVCPPTLRSNRVLTEQPVEELIRGILARESWAATELVRRYEPEIARAIRLSLLRLRLHRVVDAADVSQTVLAKFFVRLSAGGFHIAAPEDLRKLLLTMARKRVVDEARRHQATRRDARRVEAASSEQHLSAAIDSGPSPSRIVAGREGIHEEYPPLTPPQRDSAGHASAGR